MPKLRRFLRLHAVEDVTGIKRSNIYNRIARGTFPKPVPLGEGRNSPVGWPEDEIAAWQEDRVKRRDAAQMATTSRDGG
jgi:prophage regulatory protein